MEQAPALHVAQLRDLERLKRALAGAEPLDVVKAAGDVQRDQLVPAFAIELEPILHRRSI